MAFKRRFSGFRRRGSSANRGTGNKPRWIAFSGDQLLNTGTTAFLNLVDPATIGIGTGLEQELRVDRIVGRLQVRLAAGTENIGTGIGLGFIKTGVYSVTLAGFQDPNIASELATRDWLHVANISVPPNGGTNGWHYVHPVDVRVKRNLKATDAIGLAMSNLGAGDDVVISIDVRILIVVRI